MNAAITVAVLLCLGSLWSTSGVAQIQDNPYQRPVMSVRVAPAQPYVQEQIVQSISLTSAHPFEELNLELPDVPGSQIVTLLKPRNRPYATYGFDGYLYETARAVFAQRSGSIEFRPVVISGSIRLPDGTLQAFRRSSEATRIEVSPAPESFGDDWWLIAKSLQMRQEYSKPLEQLRVGDIVRRQITISANGVTAEQLPLPVVRRTRDMTVFPLQPTRQTTKSVNGVTAQLVQSFDLQIDADGVIDFAPVTIAWWDASADRKARAAVMAARVEPLPKDVETLVADLMRNASLERRQSWVGLSSLLLMAAVLTLAVIAVCVAVNYRRAKADRQLRRVLSAQPTALAAWQAIERWARVAVAHPHWRQLLTDDELAGHIITLEGAAFGDQACANVDMPLLARQLIGFRKHLRNGTDNVPRLMNLLFGVPRSLPARRSL